MSKQALSTYIVVVIVDNLRAVRAKDGAVHDRMPLKSERGSLHQEGHDAWARAGSAPWLRSCLILILTSTRLLLFRRIFFQSHKFIAVNVVTESELRHLQWFSHATRHEPLNPSQWDNPLPPFLQGKSFLHHALNGMIEWRQWQESLWGSAAYRFSVSWVHCCSSAVSAVSVWEEVKILLENAPPWSRPFHSKQIEVHLLGEPAHCWSHLRQSHCWTVAVALLCP